MTYETRLGTYDCNCPYNTGKDNSSIVEDSYLYFNYGTNEWIIPNYAEMGASSDGPGYLKRACSDTSVLNQKDLHMTRENGVWVIVLDDSASLETVSADNGTVSKINLSGNDKNVNAFYEDAYNPDSKNGTPLHVDLDNVQSCTLTAAGTKEKLEASALFQSSYVHAEADTYSSVDLEANGMINLKGAKGAYALELTANKTPFVWDTVSVTGKDAEKVSASIAEDGIQVKGSNLEDVTVTATDGEKTEEIKVSSGEESILITEKDGQLSALEDQNGDGTYETQIIADSFVTLAATSVPYTGKAQMPAVTVKNGDVTLTQGLDYQVSYKNNVNVGTATVTITGIGKYTGTVTKQFTIQKVNQKTANVIQASNVVKKYSTKAQSFIIKAKTKGGANLTYQSNNKAIKVSKNGKVTIAKNYIGKATITISAAATANYNATTKKITVTVNPTGTKLTSVKSTKIGQLTIKWIKNAAVTGYQVQYATSGKFNGAKTLNVKSNKKVTSTLSKLKEKQKYYVRIRTYKTVGKVNYYSAWSAAKSATVKGVTAPAAVKLTSVKSAKAGEMTVKWGKNAKAGGYQLQYATAKNFKSAKTVAVKKEKTTSTTIKKLTKGKKYYVRIRTYQKVGGKTYYSAWSARNYVTI